MNTIQKRFLLFLFGCIPTRLLYTYLAKNNIKYLPHLGYIALIIGLGFMYIYITDSRKTGGEVFGDTIWWNNFRPIHSILFLMFAYFAIVNKNPESWKLLFADTLLGLVLFLYYHYSQNNFVKLYQC